MMYSFFGTARLNGVDPLAWFTDVLTRIADIPQSQLHELLPGHWKAAQQANLVETMAAISTVYTIRYVAELIGENEDLLHSLSIEMEPEDGCIHVFDGKDDGTDNSTTAFTQYGIECLRDLLAEYRKSPWKLC